MEGVGNSADFPNHAGRYKVEAESNLLSLAPRCLCLLYTLIRPILHSPQRAAIGANVVFL